jgi:hypothetical protein
VSSERPADGDDRFHVRCTHLGCRFHIVARGEKTARRVRGWHEHRTGHDVETVADEDLSFTPASELPASCDPSTAYE